MILIPLLLYYNITYVLLGVIVKVLSSLKTAKQRHPDCQVVRRRGRIYVICKTNPRFKAVQG